jgi:HJR/Mrr/RecB family endonuclease
MLCENENTLKIHTLSTSRIGLPILNAEIKFKDVVITAKVLLDSGSEVTVVKSKFKTRNVLLKKLILTKPVTIKGVNSDLSLSKKMKDLDLMKREGLCQSLNTMAYIIETDNDYNDADIILQANLSISILREPKG